MDWVALFKRYRATLVDRVANHIANSSEYTFANRNRNRISSVGRFHTTFQSVGCRHGNCSDPAVAQVLLNFQNQTMILIACVDRHLQRVVNLWDLLSLAEIDVHDRTDHSYNSTFAHAEVILRRFAH